MSTKHLILIGEVINNAESVEQANALMEHYVVEEGYEIVLHEFRYADFVVDEYAPRQPIDNCAEGERYDPRLNPDLYNFALKHDVTMVGIDPGEGDFIERERHMLECIENVRKVEKAVVVVSDTRLRTQKGSFGQISLLQQAFGDDKDVTIHRAKNGKID